MWQWTLIYWPPPGHDFSGPDAARAGATAIYFGLPSAVCDIMADHAEVQEAVDAAVQKGQYPDRKAAVAGLMKQLIDLQRGALKGKLPVDPVPAEEKAEVEAWQALLKQAGGDEDKAVQLYAEELKKMTR